LFNSGLNFNDVGNLDVEKHYISSACVQIFNFEILMVNFLDLLSSHCSECTLHVVEIRLVYQHVPDSIDNCVVVNVVAS